MTTHANGLCKYPKSNYDIDLHDKSCKVKTSCKFNAITFCFIIIISILHMILVVIYFNHFTFKFNHQ